MTTTPSATTPPEQGLEKASAKTPEVIKTPEQYRGAMLRWQESKYNILTPFSNISGLAPSHGIQSTLININIDKESAEAYDGLPWLKKDEYALSKKGLLKLAEALGISWQTFRTDPRTIANFWEMKCVCSYRGIDGTVVRREATKDWDLRDGSAQMKGWTPHQVEEARKHGLRNCEARAINAAIRLCGSGVKQKYTRTELSKQFAVVKVFFDPDYSDPEIKRAVTERALAGTTALYGGASLPTYEEVPYEEPSREPKPAGFTSTVPAEPEPPAEEQPPTPDAVRIADIKELTGTKNGRAWVKWLIIDHKGIEHSTFSRTLRAEAAKLMDSKAWATIDEDTSEDGKYTNIIQIQPHLPIDDSAL